MKVYGYANNLKGEQIYGRLVDRKFLLVKDVTLVEIKPDTFQSEQEIRVKERNKLVAKANRKATSEIKKIKKLGKTLPENDDFNHSFKFTYNDEIKFIQYFTLTTQNNFLKVKEHFHISDFKKEKNNLYTYSFTDINNSEYDPKMN